MTVRIGSVSTVDPLTVILDGDSDATPVELSTIHAAHLQAGARVVCTVRSLQWGAMQVILTGVAGGIAPPLALTPATEWWWGSRAVYGPVICPAEAATTPPGATAPASPLTFRAGATYRFSTDVQIAVSSDRLDGLAVVRLKLGSTTIGEQAAVPAGRYGDFAEGRPNVHVERVWRQAADAQYVCSTEIWAATAGIRVFSQGASPYSSITCLGYGA